MIGFGEEEGGGKLGFYSAAYWRKLLWAGKNFGGTPQHFSRR